MIKNLIKFNIVAIFILFLFIVLLYVYAWILPPIKLNKNNSFLFYDINDNIIDQGFINSSWINIDDIDTKIVNYFINVEDKNFYNHFGFDIPRISKEIVSTIVNNKIGAGASSISQQYVKNLYLKFDKTWERKIKEAFLTMRLETHFSKNDILEGYLNTIYFGNGIYGINNASLYYFNKNASNLSIEEAIILTGIPKNPNNNNPISNFDKCLKRSNIVAKVLLENGAITNNEYNNLHFNNVYIYGKEKNNSNTILYYKDAVLDELYSIKNIPEDLISTGNLKIFTNLDVDTQLKLEESINLYSLNDNTQIASIIANPQNGKIVALTGGKNYSLSEFNRAIKAKRQVGSTIKPFLYYAAIEAGMTEATKFKSEETTFVFGENKTYSPTNYGNKYANKDITMASALAFSDNIYAVKTHLFLGENILVNTLKNAGLKAKLAPNPSLALGACEITMLDYISAYSTLANEGIHNDLYFISRIEDLDGNILYKHEDNSKEVLNSSSVYIINEMMRNTYNYDFVDYVSPTVLYLNGKLNRKYALKSGTTDNDYWFSGYNKDAIMLIWAGNDDNSDVNSSYSKIIKDIWNDTISYYLKDKEDNWYTLPTDVIAMPMDPISGTYKTDSRTLFYFKDGTQYAYLN